MSSPPSPIPSLTEADDASLRAALHELVAIGTELARDVRDARRAEPPGLTHEQAAAAFERVARAVRRTVLLARHLAQAPPVARATKRRALIRAVQDAIHREERAPTPEAKDRLEAEFRERLDAPELEEDLAARPLGEVLRDVLRDMDLGRLPLARLNWRRRAPDAVRRLHALAARPPGTVASAPPSRPAPPASAGLPPRPVAPPPAPS